MRATQVSKRFSVLPSPGSMHTMPAASPLAVEVVLIERRLTVKAMARRALPLPNGYAYEIKSTLGAANTAPMRNKELAFEQMPFG